MRHIVAARVNNVRTAGEFAKLIGEHQQNISKMDQGLRYPTLNHLCTMCELFNISPRWLLLDKGVMMETGPEPADSVSKELKEIKSLIKGLKKS